MMKVKYFWLALLALVSANLVAAGPPNIIKSRSRSTGTQNVNKEELKMDMPKSYNDKTNTTATGNKDDGEKIVNSEEAAKKRCDDMIGKIVDGKFVGLEVEYDLAKILFIYGGYPGKIRNTTWHDREDAPVDEEDLDRRPLPDADEKYWIYSYGDTDYKTYIRTEHAVHRFRGTIKAFMEVRGMIFFTPDDFCGKARRAIYTVDDRGFTFKVTREYCEIDPITVSCTFPKSCKTDNKGNYFSCIAAPSSALLASLVG